MNRSVFGDENKRCIVVVGMHRSGTSALTGVLQQAGVYLGDVNNASQDNVKGNKESKQLMDFHDDILERNGGAWNRPTKPLKWSPIHYHFRDLYLKNLSGRAVYGFKDPRTILVLGDWLNGIPDAEVIGIFRHPYLVAQSLLVRNNMPVSEGLGLWIHYNRDLFWHMQHQQKIRLIEFSLDSKQFEKDLEVLLKNLGLSDASNDFFDRELRSAELPDYSDVKESKSALALYTKLQSAKKFVC